MSLTWRELSLSTKRMVHQAVVRPILLYGRETWPVHKANDSTYRTLQVKCRGCAPTAEMRRRLRLTNIPAQLVQRRKQFGGQLKTPVTTLNEYGEIYGTASLRVRAKEKGLDECPW